MPKPPKRRKTEQVPVQRPPPQAEPFNLDAILNEDLTISDEEDNSNPLDKGIQSAVVIFSPHLEKYRLLNPNCQPGILAQIIKHSNCKPYGLSGFRYAGIILQQWLLTRHLLDAIRAASPTLINNPSTTSL